LIVCITDASVKIEGLRLENGWVGEKLFCGISRADKVKLNID